MENKELKEFKEILHEVKNLDRFEKFMLFCMERLARGEEVSDIWNAWVQSGLWFSDGDFRLVDIERETTMENKKESTEVLFRHLLLRRCTDAEREKAETRALNGPTKEHKIKALDIVRRFRKSGWRF